MSDINELIKESLPSMGIVTGPNSANWKNRYTSSNQFSEIGRSNALNKSPKEKLELQTSSGMDRETFYKIATSKKGLNEFQKKMIVLIANKRDMFVNVSPSGGKTSPVVRVWETFLRETTIPSKLPKLVWICPNRQLAGQVITIIRHELLDSAQDRSLPIFLLQQTLGNHPFDINLTKNQVNEFTQLINSWIAIEMDVAGGRPVTDNSIVCICTWNKAINAIQKMNPKIIVVDEVQERFKVENDEQTEEQLRALFKTLKVAPKTSSVSLLTGSVNSNIIKPFIDYVNSKYNRNFEPVIEAVANRASLQVFPASNISKYKDIIQLVKNQIKGRTTNNLIAKFSGNVIKKLSDDLIKELPAKDINYITGNHEKISPYSSQYQYRGKFSPNPDRRLATIAREIKSEEGSPKWLTTNLQEMINGQDKNKNERNKHLAQCILRGFGYIKAPKEADGTRGEMHIDDLKVVENLFKSGKISTVFTTTMAGVGVNLKVSNLYITSLQIYPGKNISDSDLVQLVHRAGRDENVAANIFCPPDDILKVCDAIKASPQLASVPNLNTRLTKNDFWDPKGEWDLIKNIFHNYL